jgi:hypothetical protein
MPSLSLPNVQHRGEIGRRVGYLTSGFLIEESESLHQIFEENLAKSASKKWHSGCP